MKRMIELVKQHWVWIVLILMVIGLALVSYFRIQYKEQTATNQPRSAQTSDKEKEGKPETANEKAYRKAKLALEHPYSAVSDEVKQSVTPDIVSALDFITSHANLDDMTPTLDNHLYISEAPMIQSVWIAIHANHYTFQPSQLEVLKSNSDDVVQVLLTLTKTGADNVYVIGNFNTTVKQLQITQYFGGRIGATYG